MLKTKDLRILSQLRNNARQKLTSISKQTHLPISTIYDRIRYQQGKLIKKHCSLLNFEKLGFQTRAYILFKVHKKDKAAFAQNLKGSPEINSMYKINNGYDYITECIFRNINELERFLDNLDDKHNIKSKEVHYIIEEMQRESFLTDMDTAKRIFQN